jgi:hyperosmotically inducible periplasmic protein
MKKFLLFALAGIAFITFAQSCKKKVKDEDIAKEFTTKIGGMGDMMKGGAASVKDGIVTITGECKDQECHDKCKADFAAMKESVKGVKDVKFECTVAPPPPPPAMPTGSDGKITEAVGPMMKDMKGASFTVVNGVATVMGVADVSKRAAIKQAFIKAGAKNVEFK